MFMPKVISAFDDHEHARVAVDRLVRAGFPRAHIARGGESDLFTSTTAPLAWSRQGHEQHHHEEQGVLSSIGHALATVFGMDTPDEEARTYLEAIRRGHSVVVVEWADEAGAQRARQIMREAGAIDVHERARQWHSSWSGERRVSPPLREDEYVAAQDRERLRVAERALAADQAGSGRAWGAEGAAGATGDKTDTPRR
jgi:hypothetical protein